MYVQMFLILAARTLLLPSLAQEAPIVDRSFEPHVAGSDNFLDRAIQALGGEKALTQLQHVFYQAPTMYRSQSVMQKYNLFKADVYVSTTGSQNISFSYISGDILQQIDRRYTRSEYWYFGQPRLEPGTFGILVKDGKRKAACYLEGNDVVFEDPTTTSGCVDDGLARFLSRQAGLFSPRLVLTIKEKSRFYSTHIELHPDVYFPAVIDETNHITVILQPHTYLPYIIRSHEKHYVLGTQTTDIQLTNYTMTEGVKFPRRFLTIVDNDSVLEDFLVERISINQHDAPRLPHSSISTSSSHPRQGITSAQEYPQSEIAEFYRNLLWHGPYTQTLARIKTAHPITGLPNLWHLMFPDADNYENVVVEFEHAVFVLDAPPHQSRLIKQWVKKTLKKKITHLWVTHHHRDHSGGAPDIIGDGAALVRPEVAAGYWERALPKATIITFNETHPFIYHDRNMQVRFIWQKEAVHALDWTYAIVTSACPGAGDGIVAFEADAWSPGTDAIRFDMNFAREWLRQADTDGLSVNASVIAAHGRNVPGGTPLKDLIDVTGYGYPALNTKSWKNRGSICLTP